jgi:hypothetical protein
VLCAVLHSNGPRRLTLVTRESPNPNSSPRTQHTSKQEVARSTLQSSVSKYIATLGLCRTEANLTPTNSPGRIDVGRARRLQHLSLHWIYNRGTEYSLIVLVFTYLLLGMQFLGAYQDAGWRGEGGWRYGR